MIELAKPPLIGFAKPAIIRPNDLPVIPAMPMFAGMRKPVTSAADPFTRLLLHFDGADTSTTFTDSSPTGTPKVFTVFGNAQLDTAASPVFGTACGQWDGSGDIIRTPTHVDFDVAAGDFTIDAWMKSNNNANFQGAFRRGTTNPWNPIFGGFEWRSGSSLFVCGLSANSTSWVVDPGTAKFTIVAGVWFHMAMVRNGNWFYLFKDGVLQYSQNIGAAIVHSSGTPFDLGQYSVAPGGTHYYFWGNIDEFRFSKGIARWTSNFTPPTSAY